MDSGTKDLLIAFSKRIESLEKSSAQKDAKIKILEETCKEIIKELNASKKDIMVSATTATMDNIDHSAPLLDDAEVVAPVFVDIQSVTYKFFNLADILKQYKAGMELPLSDAHNLILKNIQGAPEYDRKELELRKEVGATYLLQKLRSKHLYMKDLRIKVIRNFGMELGDTGSWVITSYYGIDKFAMGERLFELLDIATIPSDAQKYTIGIEPPQEPVQ